MKKIFSGFGVLLSLLVIRGVFGGISNLSGENVQETIDKEVNKMNAELPMMVDKDIRLDKVSGENEEIHYNATLVNLNKGDLDIQEFNKGVKLNLMKALCEGEDSETFRDIGIPLNYIFSGKDGNHISAIKIEPSQCTEA